MKFVSSTLFLVLIIVSISSIINHCTLTYSQETNLENARKKGGYLDTTEHIVFDFPEYWQKVDGNKTKMIFLNSPIPTVGVILQKFSSDVSTDEISMNIISFVKSHLKDSQIIGSDKNINESNVIEPLLFTYKNSNQTFKVLQLWKLLGNQMVLFTYYSDQSLFERFSGLASDIYKSMHLEGKDTHNNLTKISSEDLVKKPNYSGDKLGTFANNSLSPSPLNKERNVKYEAYKNNTLGIKFEYPSSFEILERNNGASVIDSNGQISASIGILPSKNRSVDQFLNERLTYLNNTLSHFNLVNFTQTMNFGYPTNLFVFTYSDNGDTNNNEGIELWKIEGDEIHIFTIYALEGSLTNLVTEVTHMIDSIRWNEY